MKSNFVVQVFLKNGAIIVDQVSCEPTNMKEAINTKINEMVVFGYIFKQDNHLTLYPKDEILKLEIELPALSVTSATEEDVNKAASAAAGIRRIIQP